MYTDEFEIHAKLFPATFCAEGIYVSLVMVSIQTISRNNIIIYVRTCMYSLYTEYTLHNATITMQKGVCAVDRVHGVSAGYDRLPETIHEYFI